MIMPVQADEEAAISETELKHEQKGSGLFFDENGEVILTREESLNRR